jgi:hypothetical protein
MQGCSMQCAGAFKEFEDEIATHIQMAKLAGLGLLAVQCLALWVATSMHHDWPQPMTTLPQSEDYADEIDV